MRTLKEIEDDMDHYGALGDVGTVMDLVDEHGNTIDQMFCAIFDGKLDRIYELEPLGIDITEKHFLKAAIKHNQQFVVHYQVKKGANLDDVIDLAKDYEMSAIEQWAKFCKRNKMGNSK